uniref:SCP domain-containing protein n=1 Tax=Electrophorus electricus TaxID=8005 RepID=A0A4W4G2J6_ELEEL
MHNAYRSQHGAPPLTVNRTLCRSAQVWAEHLLSIKTLKHSDGSYGENLFYTFSSGPKKLTGHEAVDSWYSEIKDYRFNRPGFTSGTGHFTQVIWKDTKELGVGLATDGAMTFVVGQYLPAGNISNAGYFEKNVLPPGSAVDTKPIPTRMSAFLFKIARPSGFHPSKPGPSSGADKSFEAEFLKMHNAYRSQHGAPPLTVNRTLCRSAQVWAEHLLSIKTLKHSDGSYGENLFYTFSSGPKKLTGHEAVDSWYSEIKDYRFNRPGFTSGTGHFTQVIWKDTKELGVGLATDGAMTFVVGQYLPAGNISNAGYFEKNVLPPGSAVDTKPIPTRMSAFLILSALENKNLAQFRNQLLAAVNRYRQRHRVQPVSLCPTLSKEAQDWAAHLVSIKTLKNSQKGHGESMSYKWTSTLAAPTAEEVAESWYNECTKYNFSSPGFQNGSGNFTQMVWKSTERAGVGLATDGKGMFITVAFYEPAGNISNHGYFQDNVKPAEAGARGHDFS